MKRPVCDLVLAVLHALSEVGGREEEPATLTQYLTALHPPQTENGASPGPFSSRQNTHPWGVFRLKANFPD